LMDMHAFVVHFCDVCGIGVKLCCISPHGDSIRFMYRYWSRKSPCCR
jgi:hypothetical protein